jgi:hypothetical protein
MSLHAVTNGFAGMSSTTDGEGEDPSWVVAGEAVAAAPKPSLTLTFRDLIDEVRRRLALKGHPWEW